MRRRKQPICQNLSIYQIQTQNQTRIRIVSSTKQQIRTAALFVFDKVLTRNRFKCCNICNQKHYQRYDEHKY